MTSKVTLEFAGDSRSLEKAAQRADRALVTVGQSADNSGQRADSAGKQFQDYGSKMERVGSGISGLTDAVGNTTDGLQALADIESMASDKAQKLARVALDVADAQEELRQSARDAAAAVNDGARAQLDMRQALLDEKKARQEYNEAVKEFGANSLEAQQAMLDSQSASQDFKEAQEDANQSVRDAARANLDGREAQLALNDAQKAADPSNLQKAADLATAFAPLLLIVGSAQAIVTAGQWAWNAAMTANPIGLVVVAVGALVAAIVFVATKTTWFQDLWRVTWGAIKSAASAVGNWFRGPFVGFFTGAWNRIRSVWSRVTGWFSNLGGGIRRVFSGIGSSIIAPFRAAFNAIARAWNNTVGRLSFTVPGWVPGIGGNSFSAPNLPTFHSGGIVPGVPGQEVMTMLRAGERVSSESSQIGGGGGWIAIQGNALTDAMIAVIAERMGEKGGRAAQLGIRIVT